MAAAQLTTYVKGDPTSGVLGDCPFCHRVLLTLETKQIPYEKQYIDFEAKPDWLLERSGGKVPLLHRPSADLWLPDSDQIAKYLDAQWPSPSMASSVPAAVTGSFFGAFRAFLMAQPDEAAAKQAAFEAEAAKASEYLTEQGPFFGGAQLDATDASFAPKLYHAVVALGHWRQWQLDASKLPGLAKYWEAVQALPAWQACRYSPESIVAGWAKHMG